MLAQVFSNLLNNAVKYTPDGGHIAVRVEARDTGVCVTVTDDGEGIAADMLPRVFDLFAQAATARVKGGLGIGLSLVRGLVQLHGGTVLAESDGEGKGSRFTVTLPRVDEAPAAVDGEGAIVPDLGRHRVLVVDDNRDSADTLAELLEVMGCEVTTAYDGEEALQKAATFTPTAVLLDLGMPGLSGLEVCRRLRAMPASRTTRVIAMTGWGQEQDRQRTRDAGFDEHLVKPVDVDRLGKLLNDARG